MKNLLLIITLSFNIVACKQDLKNILGKEESAPAPAPITLERAPTTVHCEGTLDTPVVDICYMADGLSAAQIVEYNNICLWEGNTITNSCPPKEYYCSTKFSNEYGGSGKTLNYYNISQQECEILRGECNSNWEFGVFDSVSWFGDCQKL